MSLVCTYLSGPMTGYPDSNFPAFREAATRLRAAGYAVVDPGAKGLISEWGWTDYLKYDLVQMIKVCQGIATLDGWEGSRGAQLEVYVARALDMPVLSVAEWLER